MTRLADRTTRIASSPTMKVTATVDRLRRSGVEVIDFGAGEPDFNTPDRVKGAGHSALDANFTRYTPVAGIADLKRAICDRYKTCFDADYDVSSCEDRCRDDADTEGYATKADNCSKCIDDKSCTSATFTCVADCAGIVP